MCRSSARICGYAQRQKGWFVVRELESKVLRLKTAPSPHAWFSERNCTSAGCEMRRIEYLLRLSVLVGLRSPPRLRTPARPSKKRMTCFVLIFSLFETSAGVKYSASSGRPAAEVDPVRQGASLCVAGVDVSGCWRLRIRAWARSSRVAFNQSRFPGWSDLSSNDQVQCTIGTLNNRRCQLMDVALPGAQRSTRLDAPSRLPILVFPRESDG